MKSTRKMMMRRKRISRGEVLSSLHALGWPQTGNGSHNYIKRFSLSKENPFTDIFLDFSYEGITFTLRLCKETSSAPRRLKKKKKKEDRRWERYGEKLDGKYFVFFGRFGSGNDEKSNDQYYHNLPVALASSVDHLTLGIASQIFHAFSFVPLVLHLSYFPVFNHCVPVGHCNICLLFSSVLTYSLESKFPRDWVLVLCKMLGGIEIQASGVTSWGEAAQIAFRL